MPLSLQSNTRNAIQQAHFSTWFVGAHSRVLVSVVENARLRPRLFFDLDSCQSSRRNGTLVTSVTGYSSKRRGQCPSTNLGMPPTLVAVAHSPQPTPVLEAGRNCLSNPRAQVQTPTLLGRGLRERSRMSTCSSYSQASTHQNGCVSRAQLRPLQGRQIGLADAALMPGLKGKTVRTSR